MASDKFRRRVYDDVCSMFDRAYQIGCTERVVDNERYVVAVGYLGDGIDVDDVRVGVTQSLDKTAFVFGRMAFSKFDKSAGSTNVAVTP